MTVIATCYSTAGDPLGEVMLHSDPNQGQLVHLQPTGQVWSIERVIHAPDGGECRPVVLLLRAAQVPAWLSDVLGVDVSLAEGLR